MHICLYTYIHMYVQEPLNGEQQLLGAIVVLIYIYICVYEYIYVHIYIQEPSNGEQGLLGVVLVLRNTCICILIYIYICICTGTIEW